MLKTVRHPRAVNTSVSSFRPMKPPCMFVGPSLAYLEVQSRFACPRRDWGLSVAELHVVSGSLVRAGVAAAVRNGEARRPAALAGSGMFSRLMRRSLGPELVVASSRIHSRRPRMFPASSDVGGRNRRVGLAAVTKQVLRHGDRSGRLPVS